MPDITQLSLGFDNRSFVEAKQNRDDRPAVHEAWRLGRLYWTLRALCEMNRTVGLLDVRLGLCREWAQRHGVEGELDAALAHYRPEIV